MRLRKESARVKDGEWPRITPPYEADYDGKDESTMLEMELTRSFSVIIIFARSLLCQKERINQKRDAAHECTDSGPE